MFKRKQIPHSTLFELTLKCNMRCIHCGSSAGNQRITELSTDEWMAVIKELSEMRCRYITLIGGEPFIGRDWFEISQRIKDFGMEFTIITNGFLINQDIISKIRKLEPYAIAISIDGGSPKTHDYIRQVSRSFEKCQQALSMLKNADIPTSVVTTLNKINLKDLPQIRSFLVNKGIAWQIQIAVPIGRFPRELLLSKEEFYSAALFIATTRKKYNVKELPITGAHCFGYNSEFLPNIGLTSVWNGCQAGITTLGIQSDGGVKGCLSLPDDFIEGNIRNRSLIDMWNDPNAFLYNRNFKKEYLKNECRGCKYGKTCKGGCLSVSTSLTDKTHCDPYCLRLIEKSLT